MSMSGGPSDRWVAGPQIADLWQEIVRRVPQADELVQATTQRVRTEDDRLWAEMQRPENQGRRDSYLVRYGLPVAELAGWPTQASPILVDALAAHIFWSWCWRKMDDVLDGAQTCPGDAAAMAAAVCRAARVQARICGRHGLADSDEAISLLMSLCSTAEQERTSAVPKGDIWRRATPFLIAGRTLLKWGETQDAIYRAYINVDGLSHDIHDLLGDVRLGIRSMPLSWFDEIDGDRAFRRDIVDRFFDRARSELLAAIAELRAVAVPGRYPILDVLVGRQFEMAESLGAHSRPGHQGV